jgi:hypothetical protein
MKRSTIVLALLLSTGCIPVIAGALIVKSSKSKGQKQEFMSQLQHTNMQREEKGLQPLDWCSEAYRFDKGWAMNDSGCATRVAAYEGGDNAALDGPSLPAMRADSTAVSDSAAKS